MKKSKTEELRREIDKNELINTSESSKLDVSAYKSFMDHNAFENKWNYKYGNQSDPECFDDMVYFCDI